MTDYYVLHSGGMDSTTALALAQQQDDARKIIAVGIDYGQRHLKELEHASLIHKQLNVESCTLDLTGYGRSVTSALTSNIDVPDGDYSAENMNVTVVPGRNAVMLSAVAGMAASRSGEHPAVVVAAVHSGDHYIYPDCRPEFIEAMNEALQAACGVRVWTPFINKSKIDIAGIGAEINAPLSLSWSCYKGGEKHCGTCGTCVERKEAFIKAGVEDPTIYES